MAATGASAEADAQVQILRKILTSEQEPLARRFRALFSLKYLASLQPPTEQNIPAIAAIAAAFTSPSALLKHELAYCLGQSRHDAAISPLRRVLEDKAEDAMCRHEAAEALGALGDLGSLDLLKGLRDDAQEPDVVRETCDIAVDRIEWEHGLQGKDEQLKKRCVLAFQFLPTELTESAILHPSIPRRHYRRVPKSHQFQSSKRPSSTLLSRCSSATEPCLLCATWLPHQTSPQPYQLFNH